MDKKAKIRAYKDTRPAMGVYQISNTANGRILLGSNVNMPAVLNRFATELRFGSCRIKALQDDWKQFGPDAFEFTELELLEPENDPAYDPTEDLRVLEELWTDKLQPYGDKGYNKPVK